MSISSLPTIEKVCIQLVGISGKAGSGKDTVANYLCSNYENCFGYPFARPLKLAAAIQFGIPIEHFHQRDLKEIVNPYWGVSPRKIAQFMGTESVREGYKELLGEELATQFWIRRLCGYINGTLEYYNDSYELAGDIDPGDTVIVTDVRFQNEYDWIMENNGIMIHLIRPGADGNVGIANHQSEQGYLFDSENYERRNHEVINDGTFEELYAKIDAIMKTTEPTAENMEL